MPARDENAGKMFVISQSWHLPFVLSEMFVVIHSLELFINQ
jgi:hypothetical protein